MTARQKASDASIIFIMLLLAFGAVAYADIEETDWIILNNTFVNVASDNMTGNLNSTANITAQHITSYGALIDGNLNITGNITATNFTYINYQSFTITEDLTVEGNASGISPTLPAHFTTKEYADTQYVNRTDWLQNGFPNTDDSSISFSDGNMRFTINPSGASFDYFVEGVKYTVNTSDVENVNYVDITDTEGDWWIYYDDSTLTATRAPNHAAIRDIYENKAAVAIVFWDADNTKGQLMEDRHGLSMSPITHVLIHQTVGVRFDNGLALNNITTDQSGSADSHAQFGVDAGQIFDEDIEHTLNAVGSTTGLQIWYRDASGWTFTTNAGFSMVTTGTGRLAYDNSGNLTEVTNGDFVLAHIFASGFSHNNPVVAIGQAQYASKKLAQAGALTEIVNILSIANIAPELKPIASVIFQTKNTFSNSVKAIIVSTDVGGDYVDFRTDALNPAFSSAQDHGNLAGLGDDDHAQYLLADGTRNLTGSWNMSNQILTNVNIDTGVIDNAVTQSEWDAAYSHVSNDGTDHSFIDQDVTTTAFPNFTGINTSYIQPPIGELNLTGIDTGDANVAWIGFYDDDGVTRRGFIGDADGSNDDIYVVSDTGEVRLYSNKSTVGIENVTFNLGAITGATQISMDTSGQTYPLDISVDSGDYQPIRVHRDVNTANYGVYALTIALDDSGGAVTNYAIYGGSIETNLDTHESGYATINVASNGTMTNVARFYNSSSMWVMGSGIGDANVAWTGYRNSAGSAMYGYVGDWSASDDNMNVVASTGDLNLSSPYGTVIVDNAVTFTGGAMTGVTDLTTSGTVTLGAGLITSNDDDLYYLFGRAFIGYNGVDADEAVFGHRDARSATDYAIKQLATGQTIVNTATGQAISLTVNNADKFVVDTDTADAGIHIRVLDGHDFQAWSSGNDKSILMRHDDTNGLIGTSHGDLILAPAEDVNLTGNKIMEASSINLIGDEEYGSGWDGNTTSSPSKNAVYDEVEIIKAGLMIGSANSAWIPMSEFGDGATDGLLVDFIGVLSNTGSQDGYVTFILNMPTNRGGLKLYVSGIRIGLADADTGDEITRARLYAREADSTLSLKQDFNPPSPAWNGVVGLPQLGEELFTADDMSAEQTAMLVLNFQATNTNDLDFTAPALRVYYDT